MKTIKIQNCTYFKDRFFKLIVNDETQVMSHQFFNIHVDDDKPFEIKVKYFGNASPVYIYEPKDNMLLQISLNRRMTNWSLVLFFAGLVLSFVIMYFYSNVRFISFTTCLGLLLVAIHQTIRRESFFTIEEIV